MPSEVNGEIFYVLGAEHVSASLGVPTGGHGGLRYFATIPLATEPELCVSVFVADFEALLPF